MASLVFDVLWRDRGAERGMKNLGGAAEKTTRSFGTLAKAGLLVAGVAAVKFGKDSVAAFKESQAAQARLSDAYGRFPKLADTNINALRGLNTELAKKTRFDDDATASGQAVLAQFKLTGQQITQLTPLLQDYAAKTGKDLPTAAKDLGRAMLGQGRALKTVGIDFKDTGSAGGNFTQIMTGLRTQVGGFAEREGKTAAGQTEILRNQFGELQETAGAKLVPALTKVVGGLIRLVGFVDRNRAVIGPLVGVTAGLAGSIWLVQKASVAWSVTQGVTNGLATKAVGGLSALKVAFTGVAISATAAGRAVKIAQLAIPGVGIALFAVTTAMQFFANRSEDSTAEANSFADAMQSVEGRVTQATAALNNQVRAQAVSQLQTKGAYQQAKLLGLSYSTVTDAALGNKAAVAEVNRVMAVALALNPSVSRSNKDLNAAARDLGRSLNGVGNEALDAADAERTRRTAMTAGVPPTNALAIAQRDLSRKSKEVRDALRGVINNLTILKRGALDQAQADLAWGDALKNVTRSAKEHGKALHGNTENSRENRRSIIAAIIALDEKTKADFKNANQSKNSAKATKEASARYRENRKDLREAAIAAGFSKEEVRKMIAQYTKTPKALKTEVSTPGSKKSREELRLLEERVKALKSKKVDVNVSVNSQLNKLNRAIVKEYGKGGIKIAIASGGVLPGFTPGRDVHRFYSPTGGQLHLSGGEAVMRPEWTRAVGGPAAVARMNASARGGRGPGFADGGVVNRRISVGSRVHGETYNYSKLRDYATDMSADAARAMTKNLGLQATREAFAASVKAAKAARDAASAASSSVSSSQGRIDVGRGWGPIMRAMRRHGARNFTTYPGHHPSSARARDVTPHNWSAANAAKALSSVWYVIYRMKIASKNHGNGWRTYHPTNRRGDWRHVRHIHVARYDQGGDLPPGLTLAVNGTGRSERVTPMRRGGGGRSVAPQLHFHFDRYVGNRNELVREITDLAYQGKLNQAVKLAS